MSNLSICDLPDQYRVWLSLCSFKMSLSVKWTSWITAILIIFPILLELICYIHYLHCLLFHIFHCRSDIFCFSDFCQSLLGCNLSWYTRSGLLWWGIAYLSLGVLYMAMIFYLSLIFSIQCFLFAIFLYILHSTIIYFFISCYTVMWSFYIFNVFLYVFNQF